MFTISCLIAHGIVSGIQVTVGIVVILLNIHLESCLYFGIFVLPCRRYDLGIIACLMSKLVGLYEHIDTVKQYNMQDVSALGPSSAILTVRSGTVQLNTTQVRITHEMCVWVVKRVVRVRTVKSVRSVT